MWCDTTKLETSENGAEHDGDDCSSCILSVTICDFVPTEKATKEESISVEQEDYKEKNTLTERRKGYNFLLDDLRSIKILAIIPLFKSFLSIGMYNFDSSQCLLSISCTLGIRPEQICTSYRLCCCHPYTSQHHKRKSSEQD